MLSILCVCSGYRCPHADCAVSTNTWGNLLKHLSTHPGDIMTLSVVLVCCAVQLKRCVCLRSVVLLYGV